jgi:hypothetical protein
MSAYSPDTAPPTSCLLARSFAFRPGTRFTGLLEPAFFQRLADQHNLHFAEGPNDTFNPAVTTWAWLTQVISPAKSCMAASARVVVLCAALGRPVCSANPGAFCKARGKLPADFFRDAAVQLGRQVERRALPGWHFKGRAVRIVDGMLVQLPDTPENLAVYPQQRRQKPGTSPTCMRVVVLLAFATGVLLDAAIGPYKGKNAGEMPLLYSLFEQVQAGDILVGDRYYGCYLLLAALPLRGADGCFRLSSKREGSFGCGQRLGPDDWLQSWHKPRGCRWMPAEQWDRLPEQIQVRLIRRRVGRRGWRTQEVYLATSLLDPVAYPAAEVAALYLARWNGELDIRSIKQTLGMKMLTCKTPARIKAEMWVHLLGYNLTRCVMAQAALEQGLCPRQLSFAGAVQTLDAFRWPLCCSEQDGEKWGELLSLAVATHRVGNRPGRYEPREIKHRQRKYPELKKSRQQRREELLQAKAESAGKKKKGGGKDRPSGRPH